MTLRIPVTSTRVQEALGRSARVNPRTVSVTGGVLYNRVDGSLERKPAKKQVLYTNHSVSFDVQVTASSGSQTKGDAGVKLHVFSAGTGGKSTSEHQHVNRVQFAIPIVFDPEGQFDDSGESAE